MWWGGGGEGEGRELYTCRAYPPSRLNRGRTKAPRTFAWSAVHLEWRCGRPPTHARGTTLSTWMEGDRGREGRFQRGGCRGSPFQHGPSAPRTHPFSHSGESSVDCPARGWSPATHTCTSREHRHLMSYFRSRHRPSSPLPPPSLTAIPSCGARDHAARQTRPVGRRRCGPARVCLTPHPFFFALASSPRACRSSAAARCRF